MLWIGLRINLFKKFLVFILWTSAWMMNSSHLIYEDEKDCLLFLHSGREANQANPGTSKVKWMRLVEWSEIELQVFMD
ncbi:hypothetical protein I3760_02G028200 [Carya illinoinensis]|uniref:Secreted protein n=1 Tax=Carya illinoinensis TaxID=32201 RepID=A0A922FQZ0_CARIL|nr:hypothetical protein I3760_02G028200 [Carya illinoinensis]KAG6725322.1 hypothetical protein I3842_02G027500 [Carya illinoinensis]